MDLTCTDWLALFKDRYIWMRVWWSHAWTVGCGVEWLCRGFGLWRVFWLVGLCLKCHCNHLILAELQYKSHPIRMKTVRTVYSHQKRDQTGAILDQSNSIFLLPVPVSLLVFNVHKINLHGMKQLLVDCGKQAFEIWFQTTKLVQTDQPTHSSTSGMMASSHLTCGPQLLPIHSIGDPTNLWVHPSSGWVGN